jgi:hypothetical protein
LYIQASTRRVEVRILISFSSIIFEKENIEKPDNLGEKRESLIILEKLGMYEGLFYKLNTQKMVGFSDLRTCRLGFSGTEKTSSAANNCNYLSDYLFSFGTNTK